MTVNEIIDSACRDLLLVDDNGHASGDLLDTGVELLNIAIAALNSDNYIASNVREDVVSGAGVVYFRKPVVGETLGANSVGIEPPDNIMGVARQVGIRWMQLAPASVEDLSSVATMSLPQCYAYNIKTETAPDDSVRMVGEVKLNGSAPVILKIFSAQKLPTYKSGDTIYLSPLYRNLILYALEQRLCMRYKLSAYKDDVNAMLLEAKDTIDKNALVNRPMTNIANMAGSYMDDYYNGKAGVGF